MGHTVFGYVQPSGIETAVQTALNEYEPLHGGRLVDMIVSKPTADLPTWALRAADGWILELCACVTYIRRPGSGGRYQCVRNDELSHAGEETTLPDERVMAQDHETGRRAEMIADLVKHFEHEFDALFGLDEPEITYTPAGSTCCLCGRHVGPRDWCQAHYSAGSSTPQIACKCVLRSEVSHVA
jgi:hypothetical protein